MHHTYFSADDVLELYNTLQQLQIEIWIDGGWGVDALLGQQTREHQDLDIVIQKNHLATFSNLLMARGYSEQIQDDSCAWNFVLGDKAGRRIDVHVISFDPHGNGIYGPAERGIFYPAKTLTGEGQINGITVKFLTPEYQIESHTGYLLKEKDFKDVRNLCHAFRIALPTEYL